MTRVPRSPRLLFSELTGTVYVATRYTEKPHPTSPGRAIITAHSKFDVTKDFVEVLAAWKRYKRREKRGPVKVELGEK